MTFAPGLIALQNETAGMDNQVLWLAALAILTVLATSLINALPAHFNSLAKRVIAAVLAGVFAFVGTYYSGQLDTDNWARTWLIIFMAATTLYVTIVKPVTTALDADDPKTFAEV